MAASPSSFLLLFILFFFSAARLSAGKYRIGVNYGQLGDDLPSHQKAVQLIKQMNIGKVKIYDANPDILKELANINIKVCIMLPNDQVIPVGTNETVADAFVQRNVSRFYPKTRIRTLLVGNELFSESSQIWPHIVPAMINLHKALRRHKLRKVKVSTPLAMNVFQGSFFPPSRASFRADIAESVMKPMLKFLHHTNSPLFVDVYPYLTWKADASNISLDFALFAPGAPVYRDPNGSVYHNLLDLILDNVVFAMEKLGYPDIQLTLSETGWPTLGDLDERGANIYNAATYNRRLVKKVLANPAVGTPRRPSAVIDTYIFALFNEDLKPGPVTERHWGLLYPNSTRVYDIDLTGYLNESDYKPLPLPLPEPAPGQLKLWCVANPKADAGSLGGALSYACGQIDCNPIQPGHACFLPNTTLSHASYAFNDYYNKYYSVGGTCIFGGAANLTTQDPSYGNCTYAPTYV